MVSTSKKGDDFERAVYEALEKDIAAGTFYITRDFCRIFRKKGYYSRDRGANIVFDVSIEVSLPGQAAYSFLILVECKNLGRPVGIEDAEEFHSKVGQVSGANVKGIIASANSFADTAIHFSRANGFGLLRYFNSADLQWILPRSPSSLITSKYANSEWQEALRGLAFESYKPRYFDFYGYFDNTYTTSLRSFFLNLMMCDGDADLNDQLAFVANPPNDDRQFVPFVDKYELELKAARVLEEIGYTAGPVDLEAISRQLTEKHGLELRFEPKTEMDVLGQLRFDPLRITIYRDSDTSYERERFTLAHEISHFRLDHATYMAGEYCELGDIDTERPKDLGIKDLVRMEWQANALASALLMPKNVFVRDFLHVARTLDLSDRGFGMIYLDSQNVNIEAFRTVAHRLGTKYKVSKSAVKIRLKKLGFLNEG